MIKKTILMLLVLVGGVMTANATFHLYVSLEDVAWWTNDGALTYVSSSSTPLSTISAYGKTWYTCSFETAQNDITINRVNPNNTSEVWNKTVTFSINADKFIKIKNNDGDKQIEEVTPSWDNVYLNDDWNSWGGGTSHPFTGSGNTFYIDLNKDELIKLRTDDYHFRFYVSAPNYGKHFAPQNDNDIISATDYANCQEDSENGSFKIPNNVNAKSVRINLSYNNSTNNTLKWHLTASVTEYSGTTSIYYVNENGKTSLGNNVYAYVWDPSNSDLVITGTGWPGSQMTSNADGTFSITGVNFDSEMKVIFNNGLNSDESGALKTNDLTLVENKFYNHDGVVNSVTISLPYHYGSFSSDYPLEFTGDGDIKAYKASMDGDNVKMTLVTGVVPAKTGLFLVGTEETNNSMNAVPKATATANLSGNLMKPGTGAEVGTENCYSLVRRKVSEGIYTFGFAKIASTETIAIGKAYLDTQTYSAPSLGFYMDDDETTTIHSLGIENNASENGLMYNLAGQRIDQPTKGVYIVNGKKVIVK